jgi:DNA-directed RNA polymerase subunit RPC12/RpoP
VDITQQKIDLILDILIDMLEAQEPESPEPEKDQEPEPSPPCIYCGLETKYSTELEAWVCRWCARIQNKKDQEPEKVLKCPHCGDVVINEYEHYGTLAQAWFCPSEDQEPEKPTEVPDGRVKKYIKSLMVDGDATESTMKLREFNYIMKSILKKMEESPTADSDAGKAQESEDEKEAMCKYCGHKGKILGVRDGGIYECPKCNRGIRIDGKDSEPED